MESKTENSYTADSELNPCSILLYFYEWTISNFNTLKLLSPQIESPAFSVGPCKNLDLKLLLTYIGNECLKIEIHLSKRMTEEVKFREANCPMKSKLSKYILGLEFLDSDGKTIDSYKSLSCEFKYVNTSVVYAWTKESNVSRYIQNDSLTICTKLSVRFYSRIPEKEKAAEKDTQILMNDMKKLFYERNRFADILIRVGNQYVPCHKSIIHSQCSSFMTKIDDDSPLSKQYVSPVELSSDVCDVERNNYDVLHLPNENVEVLLSVLHFIYCKQLLVSQTVYDFDVYQFANKYDIQELKMFLMPTEKKLHSKIIVGKLNHTWYVKNFSSLNNGLFSATKCLEFETEIGNKIVTWRLILTFLGSNIIVLKLRRTSSFDVELGTFLKLSVCYVDGSVYEKIEMKLLFKYGTAQNRKREGMARLLINPYILYNDTLILRYDLSVSAGELSSDAKYFYPGNFLTLDSEYWIKNFEALFQTGKFSDAILIVEETEFKVHRVILAARSSVFARMFECDMVEKRSGRVKIEDASSKAMKQALYYIYTDKVEDLTLAQAVELYAVADKYDISGLKGICSEFLSQNMDGKDACNILIMADLHGDIKLKTSAKYKICRNASEALLSPGGTELISNHSLLFQDVLETLSAILSTFEEILLRISEMQFAPN